jgi:DNA-binding transcriptional MerR regulator
MRMELHTEPQGMSSKVFTKESFPTEVAARLGGVTTKVLESWKTSGFLSPTIPALRRGVSRRYSFADIVAIRVVREIRDAGIPAHALRKVAKYLSTRKGLSPAALALTTTHLVTDGDDVYEVEGDVSISTLRRPGQRMLLLMVPLDPLVSELQAKVRAVQAA